MPLSRHSQQPIHVLLVPQADRVAVSPGPR